MSQSQPPDSPPPMPAGPPFGSNARPPGGPAPAKPGPPPPGGAPPPGMMGGPPPPGMMPGPPRKLSARPYIGRSLSFLAKHKASVVYSMFLMLAGAVAPFIVGAAFGPLIQTLGEAARQNFNQVWNLPGSLYPPGPYSFLPGFQAWLSTPLSFATIFVIWAVATIAAAVLRFVQMWQMSNLEQRLVAKIQQQVYDHLQTLSLDFFTGGKTGALVQRVIVESQNVQKLLTQVLLTPVVDVIVLIIALVYLLGLSWQMTLVSFALAPVGFWLFRFTMSKLQRSAEGMMSASRELNAELNESLTGMADIQVFNAQGKRSARFAIVAGDTANQ